MKELHIGTRLATLSMYSLRCLLGRDKVTFIGVGTAGTMMSNISQLALVRVFIFRENVRYIVPPFLAAGLVTGITLGFSARCLLVDRGGMRR